MKNIYILGVVTVLAFSVFVAPTQAAERGFDTIDNAPEEKERGMTSEQWNTLTETLRDTPNGDKVMRILKRRLPGIVN